MTEAMQMYI